VGRALFPWVRAAVVAAALVLARQAPARTALTTLTVAAVIPSNCRLEVRTRGAQAGLSINLRCAQDTLARIEVEPSAAPAADQGRALAMAEGRGSSRGAEGWVASNPFAATAGDSWTTIADRAAPTNSEELTVRVDF
jgi:hypothetical protein